MSAKYRKNSIDPAEITPMHLYLSRRDFIRSTGLVAGSMVLAACAPQLATATSASGGTPTTGTPTPIPGLKDELGDPANTFYDITHYNNYYEFTTEKENVAPLAKNFETSPWSVEVSGLVSKPGTFSVDDLIKKYMPEDRIYRLRCVEAWSLVIPWVGFPISRLLEDVGPTPDAKYVAFETIMRPDEMPGLSDYNFPWPYTEGLRLDEAMNDLAIFGTGLYGGALPAQNGGGIRVVVPWKYGFKSIKAIIKIALVSEQPKTMWNTIAPNEYGFYANVNPHVDHPRWSQATERRIGEVGRRPTLMFNGYEEQVADLYKGMDLTENY
jgi:methionine sulfoxide reductase catalytic subunit